MRAARNPSLAPRRRSLAALLAMAATLALGVGACGSDAPSQDPGPLSKAPAGTKELAALGEPEGELRLVAPKGYADPGARWVSDFQNRTRCRVDVEEVAESDEIVALMETDEFDGALARGDTTLRLIAAGDAAPVNPRLVPNYVDVFDELRERRWNSLEGRPYGIPQSRIANVLTWRSDRVRPAPVSLRAVYNQAAGARGRVAVQDDPMVIAEAAMHLRSTRPELKIENPYELDDEQFTAAVGLLQLQQPSVGSYWSGLDEVSGRFASAVVALGTAPQRVGERLAARGAAIKTAMPGEGATGWSDTWMIHPKAQNPTCMYLWMNHMASPQVNAEVARWSGAAPANRRACDIASARRHCDAVRALDSGFFAQVSYWTTPRKECGDERGLICKDYSEWAKAWAEIKG